MKKIGMLMTMFMVLLSAFAAANCAALGIDSKAQLQSISRAAALLYLENEIDGGTFANFYNEYQNAELAWDGNCIFISSGNVGDVNSRLVNTGVVVHHVGVGQGDGGQGEQGGPQEPPQSLLDGLVGRWDFDNVVAGTAEDTSLNTHDGLVMGDADCFQQGNFNAGCFLDGGIDHNDYIEINNLGLAAENILSLSLWFYPDVANDNRIFSVISSNNVEGRDTEVTTKLRDYAILKADGFVRIGSKAKDCPIADETKIVLVDSTKVVSVGEWHHLAMVMNYSIMKVDLFLDGVYQDSNDNYEPGWNCTDEFRFLWLGRRKGASNDFQGKIDEVALWDRALTPYEIQALAQYSPPIP